MIMSEKFRSASKEPGNTESAGSLKEKLSGTSAPDAGVDGDLDIQDLLKKYLPEFAEEEKAEETPAKEAVETVPAAATETEIVEDSGEESGEEEAKSGFDPEKLHEAAQIARELPHIRVRGLMTIPPVETEPHGNMVYFRKVHALYVDINGKIYDNKMEYISMGMSGDFEDAIRAGSNMVRVGTAIFGQRYYAK